MLPFFIIKRIISERALEESHMYKLLDYDITEYKQLENTLNELSKQGYNCKSVDMPRMLFKKLFLNIIHIKKILNQKNIFNLGYIK